MSIRKGIAALLLLMCSAAQSWAAKPFFCTVQGKTLEYVRTDVANGRLVYRHVMTVESVASCEDGSRRVDYSSLFTKPDHSVMYNGAIKMSVEISPEGDVLMDAGQIMASLVRNYAPGVDVRVTGGEYDIPYDMKPGDILGEAHASSKVLTFNIGVDITERKVLRTETIDTPAGTFNCVVVSERKVEKRPVGVRKTVSLTWYAPGYGMIRHDTYNTKNVHLFTEILVNIK